MLDAYKFVVSDTQDSFFYPLGSFGILVVQGINSKLITRSELFCNINRSYIHLVFCNMFETVKNLIRG